MVGSGGVHGSGGATGLGGAAVSGGAVGAGGSASGGSGSGGAGSGGSAGASNGGSANGGGSAGTGNGGSGSGGSSSGGSANGGSSGGGTTGTAGTSGATPSTGCSKTPTLASGARTISSGGNTRNYTIRIPPGYDNNHPYPLVFAYHWVGGTMGDVDGGGSSGYTWSYYGLREQADNSTNSKMIFVAPDGNGGWGNGNNSDVIFTDDMIKLIKGDLCVDTQRIFAMGFSYGGGMTKALGCQRPTVFRAIAVYSGADFLSGGCDASSTAPIAYIGLHSVNDPTNPYSSGETIRDRFVKNDGCTPQDPPKPQGLTHVCTKYQGCKAGYPAEWCSFDGGGHTPAPVDGSTEGSGGGDKTWTKAEVWKFFTQF
jgi:poly(3-hydroxybutyrate) depolymerase